MKKLTLKHAQDLAAIKGGECLSDKYINSHDPLDWRCFRCDYKWPASYSTIKSTSWCPRCAGHQKLTIKDAQQLAYINNGQCLSTEYIDSKTLLEWKCFQCDNQWPMAYSNAKYSNQWCPQCAGTQKLTIEHAQKIAESKGGKCLSIVYVNTKDPLEWWCGTCQYKWFAAYNNIKYSDQWCPECGGTQKLTIKDAEKLAIIRGGKCLSTKYINSSDPLEWQCYGCNNKWFSSYNNIKNEHWCPECGGTKKITQEQVIEMITKRGGECLSTYIKSSDKLTIRCYYNHIFSMSWNKINRGQWCSDCSKSISENICKEYFEQIFGYSFKTIRPDWLLSDRGRRLELDGFCEELNLAFEHNGAQHYRNVFKSSEKRFLMTIENDIKKIQICQNRGIKLIIIPELFSKTKISDLKNFIKQECRKLNIILPNNFNELQINTDIIYYNSLPIKLHNKELK